MRLKCIYLSVHQSGRQPVVSSGPEEHVRPDVERSLYGPRHKQVAIYRGPEDQVLLSVR